MLRSRAGIVSRTDLHVDSRLFPDVEPRKVLASMAIDGKRRSLFQHCPGLRPGLCPGPRNQQWNGLDHARATPFGTRGRYGRGLFFHRGSVFRRPKHNLFSNLTPLRSHLARGCRKGRVKRIGAGRSRPKLAWAVYGEVRWEESPIWESGAFAC